MNSGATDAATAAERKERACPGCGSVQSVHLKKYSPPEWRIAACADCDFVYLSNPPEYEALVEDFAFEKTFAARKRTRPGSTRFSNLARRIRGLTARARHRPDKWLKVFGPGKVLDIGCGTGHRIKPPMTPYGIELSRALWQEADVEMRRHGGSCLHAAGAEGVWKFEPETFDGVLMHSYLEHEADMRGVLAGANRCLRLGGRLYVRVPNFGSLNRQILGRNWCGFRHPDHVNYFTRASLANAAAQAGFTMRTLNRINLFVDDNIKAVLTKTRPIEGDN